MNNPKYRLQYIIGQESWMKFKEFLELEDFKQKNYFPISRNSKKEQEFLENKYPH